MPVSSQTTFLKASLMRRIQLLWSGPNSSTTSVCRSPMRPFIKKSKQDKDYRDKKASVEAMKAYPGGLQIGGGINLENAPDWLDAGASHLIVTSFVFHDGQINWGNLKQLSSTVGREHLVLDLSCKKENSFFRIMTERWQSPTEVTITKDTLKELAEYCNEFLIHATDVEGKQQGINSELVRLLGECTPIPTTYAGGVRSQVDIDQISKLGLGKIDFTVGRALDIFGGKTLEYSDLANRYHPINK